MDMSGQLLAQHILYRKLGGPHSQLESDAEPLAIKWHSSVQPIALSEWWLLKSCEKRSLHELYTVKMYGREEA
jgi:hypothetical protein